MLLSKPYTYTFLYVFLIGQHFANPFHKSIRETPLCLLVKELKHKARMAMKAGGSLMRCYIANILSYWAKNMELQSRHGSETIAFVTAFVLINWDMITAFFSMYFYINCKFCPKSVYLKCNQAVYIYIHLSHSFTRVLLIIYCHYTFEELLIFLPVKK